MTVSLVGLAKTIASSGILGTLRADVYTAMEQMQSHRERSLLPIAFLQRQMKVKLTAPSSTKLRKRDCVSIANPGRSMKRDSRALSTWLSPRMHRSSPVMNSILHLLSPDDRSLRQNTTDQKVHDRISRGERIKASNPSIPSPRAPAP